jgi:hypothetical protein
MGIICRRTNTSPLDVLFWVGTTKGRHRQFYQPQQFDNWSARLALFPTRASSCQSTSHKTQINTDSIAIIKWKFLAFYLFSIRLMYSQLRPEVQLGSCFAFFTCVALLI